MNIHDYTAPGEYTYCGCGLLMRPGPERWSCTICRRHSSSDGPFTAEMNRSATDEQKLHDASLADREENAKRRHALGWPKLFWMLWMKG
jgi:hypothetical protein